MAYHVIHGSGVTSNIIPYAEWLVVNELYGATPLFWRTFMCPLDAPISKLLAGTQFAVPKNYYHSTPLYSKWQGKHMEVTMDKKEKKSLPEPRTYTVEQIAAMLNIGRTTAYQLVKQEEFRIVRIGNAIRVSKKSFDEWLESLELWISQETP